MKYLILYSTIVGGFFAQTEALDAAIKKAREEAGEDTWKRGFSGRTRGGATAICQFHLNEAQIQAIQIEGRVQYVSYRENLDGAGNVYPKLRVGIETDNGDRYILSLELKSDVAQRLIAKLDNCFPDQYVRISAWPTVVERGGRTFVNHAVSMKDAEGKEIPANTDFSGQVKAECEKVEVALRAVGVADKQVIAKAKANKRVECHKTLLLKIKDIFADAPETV
jgi:hypothetical protein